MCFSVFCGGQGGISGGLWGPGWQILGTPPAGAGPGGLLQRILPPIVVLGLGNPFFDPWDPPASWDPPGTPLGPPGIPLKPPCPFLTEIFRLLTPSWDPPGTPLGPPWDPWDPPGTALERREPLTPFFGLFGIRLKPLKIFWDPRNPPETPLGPAWDLPGTCLGPLVAVLDL